MHLLPKALKFSLDILFVGLLPQYFYYLPSDMKQSRKHSLLWTTSLIIEDLFKLLWFGKKEF